jgi:hypothetical protein
MRVSYAQDLFGNVMIPDTLNDFLDISLDVSGLSSLENSQFVLFPNPVLAGQVVYLRNDAIADVELGLYQMDGKLIRSVLVKNSATSGAQLFEISDLSAGIYWVKAMHGIEKSASRLVVLN